MAVDNSRTERMEIDWEDQIANAIRQENPIDFTYFQAKMGRTQACCVETCRLLLSKRGPQQTSMNTSAAMAFSALKVLAEDIDISAKTLLENLQLTERLNISDCSEVTEDDRESYKLIQSMKVWRQASLNYDEHHRSKGNVEHVQPTGSNTRRENSFQVKSERNNAADNSRVSMAPRKSMFVAHRIGWGFSLQPAVAMTIIVPNTARKDDEHSVEFWKAAKRLTEAKNMSMSKARRTELRKVISTFLNRNNYNLEIARKFDTGSAKAGHLIPQTWGTYVRLKGMSESSCRELKEQCLTFHSQWEGSPTDWCAYSTMRDLSTFTIVKKTQGSVSWERSAAKFEHAFGAAETEYRQVSASQSQAILAQLGHSV